ncbi:hypothetical protein [Thauera sinica]|uniref:Uncharacterized protein n=1 Tax=Thauera sinica TaxID=2665146 RepID=A0ABW1AL20_9RHOO|nr:hypothetical protein [Thauera sp. K11]ATE59881.1 hypothetical protein CCZ27_07895 [Thauera sp. K11]
MVAFVVGRAVRTAEPVVTVDAGLAVGVHRFQLEVLTADGRRSAADVVDVSVQRLQILEPLQPVVRPTPVDPVIRPAVTITQPTTTVTPARPGTAPLRTPRAGEPGEPPDPSASTPAAGGSKARGKRRSAS